MILSAPSSSAPASTKSPNGVPPALLRSGLFGSLRHLYELSTEDSRFTAMEGIRGLAILLVFCVHYHTLFSPNLIPNSLSFRVSQISWGLGQSGVDLFFVLSGFLIYGAVIRKPINYLKFMKRRVERIYPTFLAVFSLYLVLCVAFPSVSKLPTGGWSASKYILMNLSLLPGIFPIKPLITVAWSLSYEFFYYLFIPLLVGALGLRRWDPRRRTWLFLALAAGYVAFCALDIAPRLQLIMFVSGILLFEARRWKAAAG